MSYFKIKLSNKLGLITKVITTNRRKMAIPYRNDRSITAFNLACVAKTHVSRHDAYNDEERYNNDYQKQNDNQC